MTLEQPVVIGLSPIQLNLTLTDFEGPTDFICYRWNSVKANKRNNTNQAEGMNN